MKITLSGRLRSDYSLRKRGSNMIQRDGIKRDPPVGEIEIWEQDTFLGTATAIRFETVTLVNGTAEVVVPLEERFMLTLPFQSRVFGDQGRSFQEITVPAGYDLCLWEINMSQGTAVPVSLTLLIREVGQPAFYTRDFMERLFEVGEPLARESRTQDWTCQFYVRNNEATTAHNIGGYCVISLEGQSDSTAGMATVAPGLVQKFRAAIETGKMATIWAKVKALFGLR